MYKARDLRKGARMRGCQRIIREEIPAHAYRMCDRIGPQLIRPFEFQLANIDTFIEVKIGKTMAVIIVNLSTIFQFPIPKH